MIGADALPYGAGGYSDPLLDGHHRWPNPLDLGDTRQDLMDGIPGGMGGVPFTFVLFWGTKLEVCDTPCISILR
ncbi:hypothetical protein HYQ46_009696 [Verticillium longisporum]|nr:hypothetical protein HYQ46_009696 [Verticillium longisporum]